VETKENLFHWEITLKGTTGSLYEGHNLILSMDFPEQFPFKFPIVRFRTRIWHPNVKNGDICKEMVGEKEWQPNKHVSEILLSLQSMLLQPDIGNAINTEAAKEFREGTFEAHAKKVLSQ
jgi:ubiquitin-conjugating enzyme E2 D/E